MKYVMTSDTFSGEIQFEFDEKTELLLSYSTEYAVLSEKQQVFLLKRLPRELAEVEKFLASSPGIKFEKIEEDVTFDMFWNKYDDKVTSSKKRALKAWNKLTKGNQINAFRHINKYFMSLPVGTRKKYAETYLNAELWNN